MSSSKNTLERGQSLTYNKILYYRCISILKLIYRYFIKNSVHHPSISIRLEKIRFAYGFHLPFGKFVVSHLFSPALFICINDAPCFLQKIFQQNGSFLNIKIQSLKQKTCYSNKGGCWQKKSLTGLHKTILQCLQNFWNNFYQLNIFVDCFPLFFVL